MWKGIKLVFIVVRLGCLGVMQEYIRLLPYPGPHGYIYTNHWH